MSAGRGSRGKRKKMPAPAGNTVGDDGLEAPASDDPDGATEVDVVVIGGQDESEQSWQALLAGLAEICSGIGMALQHELCKYGILYLSITADMPSGCTLW